MTDGETWVTLQAGCKQDKEKINNIKYKETFQKLMHPMLSGRKTIPGSSPERFWGSL